MKMKIISTKIVAKLAQNKSTIGAMSMVNKMTGFLRSFYENLKRKTRQQRRKIIGARNVIPSEEVTSEILKIESEVKSLPARISLKDGVIF